MPFETLSAPKPFAELSQSRRIEEAACPILEQVGIKVKEDLVPTLRRKGCASATVVWS